MTAQAAVNAAKPSASVTRAQTDDLRLILGRASLGDGIAASLRLVGEQSFTTLSAKPAPLRREVPASIATPVAALEGALARASDSLEDQMVSLDDESGGELLAPFQVHSEDIPRRVLSPTQRRTLDEAALLIARQIDASLARLGTERAATGAAVKGCDVVDALPALCIGGPGDNRYTANAALQIDLGGNDTYRNSAGAADPGLFGGGNGLFAAVAIDLGGDDRYKTRVASDRAQVAIGSGFYGGAGFLVDVNGDDRYAVHGDTPDSQGGAGIGFGVVGAGVLADLGGDDSYLLESKVFPEGMQSSVGGGSSGEGIGLLLDASGNDSYAARSNPIEAFTPGAAVNTTVLAWGVAAAAPGIFFDGGGEDRASATADAGGKTVGSGSAISEAFGFAGLGGFGAAFTGNGDTRLTVQAQSHAAHAATAATHGFGEGILGAVGLLSDSGGDDRYTGFASSQVSKWRVPEKDVDQAFGNARSGLWGMGTGNDGVGLLEDFGGNDLYSLVGRSSATYDPTALRDAVLPFGEDSVVQPASATVVGQGFGEIGGTGRLRDQAGKDRYETNASAAIPGGKRAITHVAVQAQASADSGGSGTLIDTGGDDVYRATAVQSGGGGDESEPLASVQASTGEIGGVAVLIDGGPGRDVFKVVPKDPPCHGTRGGTYWSDCGPGLGAGVNADG